MQEGWHTYSWIIYNKWEKMTNLIDNDSYLRPSGADNPFSYVYY